MIEQPRSWRLERSGNVVFASVCAEFATYGEEYRAAQPPPTSGQRRNPAWQLVLTWDAPMVATDGEGRVSTGFGMLVPPGLPQTIQQPSGYSSLWIDPYCLAIPGRPAIHSLDRVQASRVLTSIAGDLDPERIRRSLNRVFGDTPQVDSRLLRVLSLLDTNTDIEELADQIGLSPRRLRQLSAQAIGGPLRNLRRWHRLREAGLQLPFRPTAEVAASAGFADQAHLIRTMVALCGRTPGSSLSLVV